MGTITRPELSTKNKYWIDRHRFYELKHFCMQYPLWKKAYREMLGSLMHTNGMLTPCPDASQISDPTAKDAETLLYFSDRIDLVEETAKQTDESLASYILKAVTDGVSYDYLKARLEIPCCKDVYYDVYRRFFWLLDKARN